MSSNKPTHHELIDVESSPINGRSPSIREERRAPKSECYVVIKGNRFNVLDYSSFGFSIQSAFDFEPGQELDCDFVYGKITFPKILVRRAYAKNVGSSNYQVGFECVSDSLDVNYINAYQISVEIEPEIEDILKADYGVPEMFHLKTLEFKHKLTSIREKINSCAERIHMRDNKEATSTAEDGFSRYFALFLKDCFETSIGDLEQTLKGQPKEVVGRAMQHFRNHLSDFLFAAPFVARAYYKPYGYAGDFELMNHIYNNEAIGTDLFGKCLHKAMLEAPASKAVRNRAFYLSNILTDVLKKNSAKPLRILSVASGPAKELQILFNENSQLVKNVEFHLLDQDIRALRQARLDLQQICRLKGIDNPTRFVNKAIRNVIEEGIGSEKFDVIYSAGLFDYFGNSVAFAAAKSLFDALNPGGMLIIGNFNTNNPTKFMMEIFGDWHLIHRSDAELRQLFGPISNKLEVQSEPENINLFSILKR